VIGDKLQFPSAPVAVSGALICFGLRFEAIRRGWQLPVASPAGPTTAENANSDRSGE
jgi:hypothetical protein